MTATGFRTRVGVVWGGESGSVATNSYPYVSPMTVAMDNKSKQQYRYMKLSVGNVMLPLTQPLQCHRRHALIYIHTYIQK